MPEEVLFETERVEPRADIAATLRAIADKLDAGEELTFTASNQSVSITPPARPTFEVKVERETSRGADSGELSVEFELEWDESTAHGDNGLTVE